MTDLVSAPALVSIFAIVLMFTYILTGKLPKAPPGPSGVPILGFASFLGNRPWRSLTRLKHEFGNIVGFYVGSQFTVVLQDYDAIRAAFIDQAEVFSARATNFALREVSKGQDGKIHALTALEGSKWQATRNFVVETLLDLGVGQTKMEHTILAELDRLQETIRDRLGWPFDIAPLLHAAVSNMLAVVCFGRRLRYDSDDFRELTEKMPDMYAAFGDGTLNLYPWLRFVKVGLRKKWKGALLSLESVWKVMSMELLQHEQESRETEMRDFMDAYLVHIAGKDNKDPIAFADKDDTISTLISMFVAGSEATHNALIWCMLIMCWNPSHQKRIQEEMDATMVRVGFGDRDDLPLTTATFFECLRLSGTGPLGMPRSNVQETELLGYKIPAQSVILPNIWAAHRDPKYWKNPLSFDPGRFINAEGALEVPPYFVLFSLGKRSCPGQSLAQMMTFLSFANLFHRFTIISAKDQRLPSLDEYGPPGISASPKPFLVEAIPRF